MWQAPAGENPCQYARQHRRNLYGAATVWLHPEAHERGGGRGHELAQLRGEDFSQLHIVGGGCQNTLLNQLCADACGIRVIAGPVEASTLGNIGIQLMTLDELNNVDDFRQVVSTTANLTTFTPNPDSEIAHYVAQIHSTRQTKELCA